MLGHACLLNAFSNDRVRQSSFRIAKKWLSLVRRGGFHSDEALSAICARLAIGIDCENILL